MSKKKTTTKTEPKLDNSKPSKELSDEQLEHVAGGFDGIKGEAETKEHKKEISIG